MVCCNSINIQELVLALCRWLKSFMDFWILKYIISLQFLITFNVRVYFHACWVYIFIYCFYLSIKRLLIIFSHSILGLARFFSIWFINFVNFRILINYFFMINNYLIIFLIFLWILNIIFKQINLLRNRIGSFFKLIIIFTVWRVHIWIIIFYFYFFFYFNYILPNIVYLLSINFIFIFFLICINITRIIKIHFHNFLNCNRIS